MNDRDTSRFTQPNMAIDHVRSIARATAKESGYDAAATALLALYREYRVMPLRRKETPPERLATWEAVRIETRELVPMAMAAHGGVRADAACFDKWVATPADQPLPQHQRTDAAPDPSVALQAAALDLPITPMNNEAPTPGTTPPPSGRIGF